MLTNISEDLMTLSIELKIPILVVVKVIEVALIKIVKKHLI